MTISKTGKLSRSQGGFTLFELLVAIAIAVLAMGVVISRMGRMLDWELKNSSRKLASTIRYLYNKSASENVTLRLVLDIGESTYWVESTPDAYALVPEAEETTPKERPAPEEEPAEGEIQTIQPKEAVFGPTESFLLKKVKLPKGVFFKDVFAEHQVARLDQGAAYIYFFPRGYVERSVINLRDEDDRSHYSLIVNPISGAVRIEPEYTEPKVE